MAQLKFQTQGFPHYYDMKTIANRKQAEGHMSRTSRQGPPTSDEEQDMEDLVKGKSVGQGHRYASDRKSVV